METELTVWLRKQIDEDEQIARRAGGDRWDGNDGGIYRENEGIPFAAGPYDYLNEDAAAHIARHDPARVLAEVEAKRRILDRWEASQDNFLPPEALIALDEVVGFLALPYADRPGWREEWRP